MLQAAVSLPAHDYALCSSLESNADAPARGVRHAEPGEADADRDQRRDNEDPRAPGAVVGERADDEEERRLHRKADAVGQQGDALRRPLGAGPSQAANVLALAAARVAASCGSRKGDQVLKLAGRIVEGPEATAADVLWRPMLASSTACVCPL